MNKGKLSCRLIVTIVCIACMLGVCLGYQARAESTTDFPIVKNGDQLIQAIAEADDGDIIGIDGTIIFDTTMNLGDENKHITLQKASPNSYIYINSGCWVTIQNIIFDGAELDGTQAFCNLILTMLKLKIPPFKIIRLLEMVLLLYGMVQCAFIAVPFKTTQPLKVRQLMLVECAVLILRIARLRITKL